MAEKQHIVWFKQVFKEDVNLVGGKGANLGEMSHASLPIPPGFVITAGCYKEFTERTNIKYKSDWSVHHEKEYWQSPKETLVLKTGDCEDFAFLAQALLNEIGISSSVISIQHMKEGKQKGHAICVFPKERPRGYFSGQQLHTSNKEIDANFIAKLYPAWVSISELDFFGHSRTPLYKRE